MRYLVGTTWLWTIIGLFAFLSNVRAGEAPPDVVYLDAADTPRDLPLGVSYSVLSREIVRQAFLLAAREDFGLGTRDASLREPTLPTIPETSTFQISLLLRPMKTFTLTVQRGPAGKRKKVWERLFPIPAQGPQQFIYLAIVSEQTLRKEFGEILKSAGFKARPASNKAAVSVPDEVDRWLRQMTEIAQFKALQQLHAMLRKDGESPALLAALARAYAQLGVLTEFHWATDYRVFKARALLYAQRLVEREPKSPAALETRAFVLALIGLHNKALEDLDEVKRLAKAADPKTARLSAQAELAESLCRFDTDKLLKAADVDVKNADLARLLAYLTVEDYSAVHRTLDAGRKLLESIPECYRVHDSLAGLGGVSIQHTTTLTGFAAFTENMLKQIASLPRLPVTVSDLLQKGKVAAPAVFEALVESSRSASDTSEPSLAALGRLVQETRFTQVWRRLDFLYYRLSVPVNDLVEKTLPLVAGHPYAPFIESFGLPRPRKATDHLKFLSRIPLNDLDFNRIALVRSFGEIDPAQNIRVTNRALRFFDGAYYDYQVMLRYPLGKRIRVTLARALANVSSHAPVGHAVVIAEDQVGIEQQLPQWLKQPNPTVFLAAGRYYMRTSKFKEAEESLKKSIELSPDTVVYEELAAIYKLQNKFEKWKETLEETLKVEDTGLHHARVRGDIAKEYMRRKDFDAALPYAEAAAGSGASWAMSIAAECYEGRKEWDAAERMVRGIVERYPDNWPYWYLWCRRTGHGDVQAAEQLATNWLKDAGDRVPGSQRVISAAFYQLSGKPKKALETLDKSLQLSSQAEFLRAAIQDSLRMAKERDQTLRDISSGAGDFRKPLAELFLRCTDVGKNVRLDLEAVQATLKTLPTSQRVEYDYFVGHFLALRSDKKNAEVYLKRSADNNGGKGGNIFQALARIELRENSTGGK